MLSFATGSMAPSKLLFVVFAVIEAVIIFIRGIKTFSIRLRLILSIFNLLLSSYISQNTMSNDNVGEIDKSRKLVQAHAKGTLLCVRIQFKN